MVYSLANFLAGLSLRIIEILVSSSLYLVIGCLTAGALRVLVRPERVRTLFGSGRVVAPLRAWLTATTLLPVCALGVLPVVREFRRAGVPRHAVLTFALAAPMLNPISLLSGISYLGPDLILLLLAGSMIVAVGAGVVVGPGPATAVEADAATEGADDLRPGRLRRAMIEAARTTNGPILWDLAAGILGAGVMAAALPQSYLAESLFVGDHWAIGRMATIAPLTYISPDKGMATLPEMIKFRQSAGAMFVLTALGVGMTLGHLTWAVRSYGLRTAARWGAAILVLTLAVAHGVAGSIPAVGSANADNDHFNDFANPFHGQAQWPHFAGFLGRYVTTVEPFHWVTVGLLGLLVASGLALRLIGEPAQSRWVRPLAGPAGSRWDRPVSPRLVSLAGVGLVLALGIVGVFAFYPPPSEVFADMDIIKADFHGELGARTLDPARHHLDLWERQASKLAVGSIIRLKTADSEARRLTSELRAALRTLRVSLDSQPISELRLLSLKVSQIQSLCRRAYHLP